MSDALSRLARLSPEQRARVMATLRSTAAPSVPAERPLVALPRDGAPLPAAPVQEQFWFLHQIAPTQPTYTIPFSFTLTGELDVDVLVAVLAEVERRHEVLRASLVEHEGRIVHRIAEPAEMPQLALVDLSGLPTAERERRAEELIRQTVRTVFDPARGPLLRSVLIRFSATEHLLLWVAHHAIADGISLGVLANEIVGLYRQLTDPRAPELPEPAVQYADYATWQREWLSGRRREKLVGYWTELLSGVPALDLATDFPRPPRQTFDGATKWFRVPARLTGQLRALAEREGCTLFMLLLATYQVLLARHAGQDDFAVGVPVAGRGKPEVDALIGPFLNTVALRADLADDPAFTDLLARVRDAVLDGFGHQELPFGAVVEALKQRRDSSRNPVYQVMFGFGNTPISEERIPLGPGVSMIPRGITNGTARVELELVMEEDGDELTGRLEYNTALFGPTTADRLAERFVALLRGIAAAPATRVGALPLVPKAELDLIATWNDTEIGYPTHRTVVDLVAEQARRAPDKVAVRSEGASLTYAELERRSNRLANALLELGVEHGSGVAVCLERGADTLVALLGVLKTGAHYVPLDPTYPVHRLAYMLEDSKVGIVVAGAGLTMPFDTRSLLLVDPDGPRVRAARPTAPARRPAADDVAYVIYTSGSTGRPKGVVVEHRGLVNLLCSMRDRLGLVASDVCGSLASLSFDMAVPELYLPLLIGATVVVGGKEAAADGARLRRLIAEFGLTALQATPTTWQLLLDAGLEPGALRLATCTAEAMPEVVAAGLYRRVADVWNLYGPTETTVFSTMHRITEHDLGAPPPIGTPIGNTTLHVVDRQGQTAPIGAVGELYIGGVGLARHYRGRPDLTGDRFRADLPACPGTRVYRTGDLVRYRPDGVLEYLGRADHQVKLRGFRIEPGEIETVLTAHPAVGRAYVALRAFGPDDARLVGYVVTADESLSGADLRTHAAASLPQYMVPAHFHTLPEFPLTPNGKLDRAKLLELPVDGAGTGHAPPRDETEREVAAIFAEVLGVASVGRDDDFFLIGGHSLLATQVVTRVRDRLGVPLSIDVAFDRSTVALLAAEVTARRGERTEAFLRVLRRVEGMSEAAVAALLSELEISEALGSAIGEVS
ncbi:non-ribosomal peptide synthetase [Actinokineospora auranticolor]|uniref:Amino acid adenylation domain-containing protein n=1 Tax=Actinokineospora auranticolor TaxID=155976 RepID=A0A2S6GD93_9PSEU|nr:non-ribosomal peptide synthetase [Actinokineospora auranticolor]PPK63150.1 amino acid adenylation domain-containing protein [Actinokineospora auranticolor]